MSKHPIVGYSHLQAKSSNWTPISSSLLTILAIHCGVIRPILEYAVQSWCPYLLKDIEELEKVQHRVTKLVPGMSDWTYEARCKELKLPTLKQRRLRGDLIETYKILRGHKGADYKKFFYQRSCLETQEKRTYSLTSEGRMVCY